MSSYKPKKVAAGLLMNAVMLLPYIHCGFNKSQIGAGWGQHYIRESHKEKISTTNYVVAIMRGVERELAAWNQGVRNVIEDRG